MQLSQALDLKEREIITVVGAGGKTSTLIRLARELSADGRRVVLAPTTKVFYKELEQLSVPVIERDPIRLKEGILDRFDTENLLTCGQGINERGKIIGLDAEAMDALCELDINYLILEGDGAAGAFLKAPTSYEPVIPHQTTLVVALAGLEVLGKPLEVPFIYRPSILASLLRKKEGDLIAPDDIAKALMHPFGGQKDVPAGARWVALLNQAEGHELLTCGRAIAEKIIDAGAERVVLGAVATQYPVRQVLLRGTGKQSPVGIVVLAAGCGERLGGGKQLLPIDGQPMIKKTITNLLAADLGNIVVVLGYQSAKVAAVLKRLPLDLAINTEYHQGLSSSLKAGLAAQAPTIRAVLFVLADQPQVSPQVYENLAKAYLQSNKKIIVPAYQGKRGNPVLISRELWPQIMALRGDIGARELVRSLPQEVLAVNVDCPGILKDIDTMTDYLNWK